MYYQVAACLILSLIIWLGVIYFIRYILKFLLMYKGMLGSSFTIYYSTKHYTKANKNYFGSNPYLYQLKNELEKFIKY